MSKRPDISEALEADETLLWSGYPKPGRPVSGRALLLSMIFSATTIVLLAFGWWLEIFWGHVPVWRITVYFVIATAAFSTYLALRVTLLDRRRARSRDACTAYAITDRRVLMRAGPYTSELKLGPAITARASGSTLVIEGPEARLQFERLDDAAEARDIVQARIGGAA